MNNHTVSHAPIASPNFATITNPGGEAVARPSQGDMPCHTNIAVAPKATSVTSPKASPTTSASAPTLSANVTPANATNLPAKKASSPPMNDQTDFSLPYLKGSTFAEHMEEIVSYVREGHAQGKTNFVFFDWNEHEIRRVMYQLQLYGYKTARVVLPPVPEDLPQELYPLLVGYEIINPLHEGEAHR